MVAPRQGRIPDATVSRLPVYQRILLELVRTGVETVSSEKLAGLAMVNASKVRKDLSYLGSFGTRGWGYETRYLLSRIDEALGLDRDWPVAIVGLGNLGRALANSPGFTSRGFRIASLFDVDPGLVSTRIGPVVIHHLDDLAAVTAGDPPAIGVIATPGAVAQDVADRLVEAGVGSLLNFAPRVLAVPAGVLLRYVDLSIELQVMSFYLRRKGHRGLEASGEGTAPPEPPVALAHPIGIAAPGPGEV
ncbi:MAG: redox-sensing transcriptional repressor Rex [Acidimicrobiales bacterium]|jgi:redox-sensing transcriptional repressor